MKAVEWDIIEYLSKQGEKKDSEGKIVGFDGLYYAARDIENAVKKESYQKEDIRKAFINLNNIGFIMFQNETIFLKPEGFQYYLCEGSKNKIGFFK